MDISASKTADPTKNDFLIEHLLKIRLASSVLKSMAVILSENLFIEGRR
jgi:hypothetical protein